MLVLKKLFIPLICFLIIICFVFIAWTIVSSIVQAKIKEKIESFSDQLQEKSGIIIQYGDVQVYPSGSVVIKDTSASFHSRGLPFLTFSRVTIRVKPEGFFSSFEIKSISIHTFTFRLSLDTIIPRIDTIKNITTFLSKQQGTKESDYKTDNKKNEGYIKFAPVMWIKIDKGRVFAAKKISNLFGQIPLLHKCRMAIRINMDKQEIKGESIASGSYMSDNITANFIINPLYQTISIESDNFYTEQLLPFLPDTIKVNARSAIDARISIHKDSTDPFYYLDIKGYGNNVTVDDSRIATQPVRNLQGGMRGILRIDVKNGIIKTDEFVFFVGHIPLYLRNVEIQLPIHKPLLCSLILETDHLRIQDILDSLPKELIPHIKGARMDGFMDVSVSLVLDLDEIENTNLDIQGSISCFRVNIPPLLCDVREIAAMDYLHTIHLPGGETVAFEVGPANKDFIPLKKVGRFVIEAVLTSEDGNFYVHNGFQLKHVNGAIQQNLKEKRFVRGASTVSMQLVKNLFLTNEKTVSRKLEEVLLTWWMEQEVDKKRMFEVYLNIIEWGPDIFGIGPAAAHYFNCKPSELSITQATWLASILINPSLFYYMKQEKKIDESMRSVIRYVMKAIRKQGGISEAVLKEAEKKNYEVYFP